MQRKMNVAVTSSRMVIPLAEAMNGGFTVMVTGECASFQFPSFADTLT